MKFDIVRGDITKAKTDIIVNSLGTNASYYGAICTNILNKAKSKELKDYIDSHTKLNVFDILVTGGYGLKCNNIIHIVTPFKKDDDINCTNLKKTYESIVNKAIELGASSIAIPFIGSGANGYSSNESYISATSLLKTFEKSKEKLKVTFVWYEKDDKKVLKKKLSPLEREKQDIEKRNSNIKKSKNLSKFGNKPYANFYKVDIQDAFEINSIFTKYNLDDVQYPGEPDEDTCMAYHFLTVCREARDTEVTKSDFIGGYMLNPNRRSLIKKGIVRMTKIEAFGLAISAKLNVSEAILFLIYSGHTLDPNDPSDVTFYNYLIEGNLPETISDFAKRAGDNRIISGIKI